MRSIRKVAKEQARTLSLFAVLSIVVTSGIAPAFSLPTQYADSNTPQTTDQAQAQGTSTNDTIDLSDATPSVTSGTAWVYADDVYTVTDNANLTVTGTGVANRRVEVAENANVTITLSSASINTSTGGGITLNAGANLLLILSGTNTFISNGPGIWVKPTSAVVITSATGDKSTEGSLSTTNNGQGAGIGGIAGSGQTPGDITINGGTINAQGDFYGAGIGASGANAGGNITINGGDITANGGFGFMPVLSDKDGVAAAGIGGGGLWDKSTNSGGNITINGGTINATGGSVLTDASSGAGIGGGYNAPGGNIEINGGDITATGGFKVNGSSGGAGIGGGGGDYYGTNGVGGNITINGGNINATSSCGSAGIGGGRWGAGGNITINGGNVKAVGTVICPYLEGAGIGGGDTAAGGNIKITGGNVTATVAVEDQSMGSAGIGGGGHNGAGGTIEISGGNVTATGGYYAAGIGGGADGASGDITISGGSVLAYAPYRGSAIGSGNNGADNNIAISGGTVIAWGQGDFHGWRGICAVTSVIPSCPTITGNPVILATSANGNISDGTNGMLIGAPDANVSPVIAIDLTSFPTNPITVTITDDFTIPEGAIFSIPTGAKIVVPEGKTLEIKGGGEIDIYGTLDIEGTLQLDDGAKFVIESGGKVDGNGISETCGGVSYVSINNENPSTTTSCDEDPSDSDRYVLSLTNGAIGIAYNTTNSDPVTNTVIKTDGNVHLIAGDDIPLNLSPVKDFTQSPIKVNSGTLVLNLADGTNNILKSNNKLYAGLNVAGNADAAQRAKLIIEGTGELTSMSSKGDEGDSTALGAGIGGNNGDDFGDITINGGTVNAYSADSEGNGYGAGIGSGGCYDNYGACTATKKTGNITINGGIVNAYSGNSTYGGGAGIGGGYVFEKTSEYAGDITINGGIVHAESSHTGSGGGAGIGAGLSGVNSAYNFTGDIKIAGGTVYAKAGYDSDNYNNDAQDIGKGSCTVSSCSRTASNVIITGGSINAVNKTINSPVNPTYPDNSLDLVTLTLQKYASANTYQPNAGAKISACQFDIPIDEPTEEWSCPAFYGINGVQTDADGKLYFYIPTPDQTNASVETTVQVGNAVYGNDAENFAEVKTLSLYDKHAVTFDTGEGGSVAGTQAVPFGQPVTIPDDPTKPDYAFLYWYASNIDVPFDFTTPIKQDITLHAEYISSTTVITVTFYAEGGTPIPEPQTGKSYNDTVDNVANPTKTGYTFTGWYATVNDEQVPFVLGVTPLTLANGVTITDADGQIALHAVWTVHNIEEEFDDNGGTPATENPCTIINVTYGIQLQQLTCNPPTKTGYTFAGYEAPVKTVPETSSANANEANEATPSADYVLVYDKDLNPIANVAGYTDENATWIDDDVLVPFRAVWAAVTPPTPSPSPSPSTSPTASPSPTPIISPTASPAPVPVPAPDSGGNSDSTDTLPDTGVNSFPITLLTLMFLLTTIVVSASARRKL